ncbi:helix-turn-helix domain-containing protein [Leptospira santarosai]
MGNIARVKRDFKALEKRRLKGLKLRREGMPRSEVARRLGVSRHAVR